MIGMTHVPGHVALLERGLRDVFGSRLQSLLVYGLTAAPAHHQEHDGHHAAPRFTRTLAVVDSLNAVDLKKCADRVAAWHELGLATPILIAANEFTRSLDAFPLEFDAIRADHACVAGRNPFDGVDVDPSDIRRACEVQARSHLLHLREGFVETQGNADALAVLIVKSAAPFAALLSSIARLEGLSPADASTAGRHVEHHVQLPPGVAGDVAKLAHVQEISASEAARLFPAYLDATERLAAYVDRWGTQ
jgi:hypothetical protein